MLLIITSIILILSIVAGVTFGSDLSRPVNLFPGSLIIMLACNNFLLTFHFSTLIITGCIYLLITWLAIIIIYLTEKQRPLAKVHQQIDKEIKWWLKQIINTVLEK